MAVKLILFVIEIASVLIFLLPNSFEVNPVNLREEIVRRASKSRSQCELMKV